MIHQVSYISGRCHQASNWLPRQLLFSPAGRLITCLALLCAISFVLAATSESQWDSTVQQQYPHTHHHHHHIQNHRDDHQHDARRRVKRALYELPDGVEQIIGPDMRTTFTCEGLGYGYYADMDNECKIFHICQSFKMSDGSIYNNHWSFMCGNQTVFNQVSLACTHPEDSIPCENAKDFYHVNDYFGDLKAPSVKEADLSEAHELVSRAYGARLSAPS